MSVTRSWRVYGAEGHRQRMSFAPSFTWNFSAAGNVRIVEVLNADRTGTHDYSIIRITRADAAQCEQELQAQLWDGAFENSRVGAWEEIKEDV